MFQLIKPDSEDQSVVPDNLRVFLAGSIDNGDTVPWADGVAAQLTEFDASVFNPLREEWFPDLEKRMHEPLFAQQVNWELDNIQAADVVFFNFVAGSVSPITLQELGYVLGRAEADTVIVCCPDGFWRKGNVEIMCARSHIAVHNNLSDAVAELRSRLAVHNNLSDAVAELRSRLAEHQRIKEWLKTHSGK